MLCSTYLQMDMIDIHKYWSIKGGGIMKKIQAKLELNFHSFMLKN